MNLVEEIYISGQSNDLDLKVIELFVWLLNPEDCQG